MILFCSFGLYQGAQLQSTATKNKNTKFTNGNQEIVQKFKEILESLNKKNVDDYGLDFVKNLLASKGNKKEKTNIEILLDKIKKDQEQKKNYTIDDYDTVSKNGLKYIEGLVNFYKTTEKFPKVHQQARKLIEQSLELLILKILKDNNGEDVGIDFNSDRNSILDLLNNNSDVYGVVWDWHSENRSGVPIKPLTIAVNNIWNLLVLIDKEPQWINKISDLQNEIKILINDKKSKDREPIAELLNQKPEDFLGTIVEIINGNGIDCAGLLSSHKQFNWDGLMGAVKKSFNNTKEYLNRGPWPSEFKKEYETLIKNLKDNNQPPKPNEKSEKIHNKTIDQYPSTIDGLIDKAKDNNYLKVTMEIVRWHISHKVVRENGGIQYLRDFDDKFLTYEVDSKEFLFNGSQTDSASVLGGIKYITPTKVESSLENLKNPTKALDLINVIDILHVTLDEKNTLTNNDRNIKKRFQSIKEGVDSVATEIKKILATQTATEDEKKNFDWAQFHNKFIINNTKLLPSLIAIDFIFSLEQNQESFAKLKALSDDDIFKMDPAVDFANDEIEKKIKEGSPWSRSPVATGLPIGSPMGGAVIGSATGGAVIGGAYYKLIANRRKYIQTKTKETSIIQILNTDAGRQQVATGLKSGVVKTLDNTKYLADKGKDIVFGGIKKAGNFLSGSYNLIAEKLKSAPKVLLNK
jgi:hypothetical protein